MSPQKEGEFTLHGRAILEMEQYIRETYPDAVKVCNICRGLLIQVPGARRGALSRTHSGPRRLTRLEPPRREQTMGVSSEASDDKCVRACLSPLVLLFCPRLLFFPPERLSEVFCGAHIILAAATTHLSVPATYSCWLSASAYVVWLQSRAAGPLLDDSVFVFLLKIF